MQRANKSPINEYWTEICEQKSITLTELGLSLKQMNYLRLPTSNSPPSKFRSSRSHTCFWFSNWPSYRRKRPTARREGASAL